MNTNRIKHWQLLLFFLLFGSSEEVSGFPEYSAFVNLDFDLLCRIRGLEKPLEMPRSNKILKRLFRLNLSTDSTAFVKTH